MTREILTASRYLEVLNESLRHHPEWKPGMAFEFWPPNSSAKRAKGIHFSGPAECKRIFDQIEAVASRLCEVAEKRTLGDV